jgi:hypothetical protein
MNTKSWQTFRIKGRPAKKTFRIKGGTAKKTFRIKGGPAKKTNHIIIKPAKIMYQERTYSPFNISPSGERLVNQSSIA